MLGFFGDLGPGFLEVRMFNIFLRAVERRDYVL